MPDLWRCLKRVAWAEGSGSCEQNRTKIPQPGTRRTPLSSHAGVSSPAPLSFGCDCDAIAGPILGNYDRSVRTSSPGATVPSSEAHHPVFHIEQRPARPSYVV